MPSKYKWCIRLGLIIIGLAGFIFAIGDAFIPQEGNIFKATENPEAFAELVTNENFRFWALRGLIGTPMETIGAVALFLGLVDTAREKIAFWGMLLCVLGDIFGVSIFFMAYYIFPKVGHLIIEGIPSVAVIASFEPIMPLFVIGIAITIIGLILSAIAIWFASNRFPKWSGVLVVFGFLLLFIQTSFVIQILANVLWGSAYLWMAIYSWNRVSLSEPEIHQ